MSGREERGLPRPCQPWPPSLPCVKPGFHRRGAPCQPQGSWLPLRPETKALYPEAPPMATLIVFHLRTPGWGEPPTRTWAQCRPGQGDGSAGSPPSAQGFTLTLRMELRTQGCRDWAELGYSSYPLDKVERLWLNTRKQKWYLCLILKKISLRCLLLESDVVNCTHLMTSQHSCRGNLGNWGKGL